MKRIVAALAVVAALAPAHAGVKILSDDDVVTYARQFQGRSWPDVPNGHALIGSHRGFKLYVDMWCAGDDGCTNDFVIHYDVAPGPDCARMGGRTGAAATYGTIAVAVQSFCVPRILYDERLFAG